MQKTDNRFEVWWDNNKKARNYVRNFFIFLGIIIFSLVFLEIASLGILSVYETTFGGGKDVRLSIDVYDDKQWAEQYFSEFQESFQAEYFPYLGHRRKPNYEGKFVTLDNDSHRKTYFNCPSEDSSINIFMFGGSTMWGSGARDIGTIPSLTAYGLCKENFSVKITNLGETGYVNTQELFQLELELRKGNIPDIVIFYDGVNDVFSSYQNSISGFPQNINNRIQEFNSRKKINLQGTFSNFNELILKISKLAQKRGFIEVPIKPISKELAISTKDVYESNIKIVQALGKEFGFHSLFYWQPTIVTKETLSKDEQNIYVDPSIRDSYLLVSEEMAKSSKVTDLTNIYDSETRTIFIDWAHKSERGNLIIAKKMTEDVINYLNSNQQLPQNG